MEERRWMEGGAFKARVTRIKICSFMQSNRLLQVCKKGLFGKIPSKGVVCKDPEFIHHALELEARPLEDVLS
jgi:hypothetical protein